MKVADIKALQTELAVRPYEGGRKVLVINEAHTMRPEAQNKLLKVLEEPPAYAVLLLLCETSSSLLETVQSRCQTVRMPRVSRDVVAHITRKAIRIWINPGPAFWQPCPMAVSDAPWIWPSWRVRFSDRDEALSLLQRALKKDGAIEALEGLEKHQGDIHSVLWVWQSILRDAMVMKTPGARLVHDDRRMQITEMAKNHTGDGLLIKLDAVMAAERRLRGNGAFPTVCHRLLLKMGGHTQE